MPNWSMDNRIGTIPPPTHSEMTAVPAPASEIMMQYHSFGPETHAVDINHPSRLGSDTLSLPLDAVLMGLIPDVSATAYNSPQHAARSTSVGTYPETHGMYAYAHQSSQGKQQPAGIWPRVVRGSISGGSVTKPPSSAPKPGCYYAPAHLVYENEELEGVRSMPWNNMEHMDGRRIVRIERTQVGAAIRVQFTAVGLAVEKPHPAPAPAGVSVVEVSCLHKTTLDCGIAAGYYITSVEVVSIVETVIGAENLDSALRRRERGRIRSNLLPFWQKRPLLSKRTDDDDGDDQNDFARRIMAYEIRRPRGFDKGVRVLDWNLLGAALERALQCYYVETPIPLA